MLRRALFAGGLLLAASTPAFAHSAARGFVLLLPTGYVIVGGALAVLATFVMVSLLPDRLFRSWASWRVALWRVPAGLARACSLLAFAILAALLWIGFAGPSDPLENLLPLTVWTLWWVVIVLLHPLAGNLWAAINPFSGVAGLLQSGKVRNCRHLDRWAYFPAFAIFAGFAWFQLVDPAPEDPGRLARVVLVYAVLTIAAMMLAGARNWLAKGDPFAIFLRQLGAAAPLEWGERLHLRMPGAGLLSLPALPLAGTAFVLLTLTSISFDGFASTFAWASLNGVNPLDYPGRTAMMTVNSLGFAGSFAVMAFVYVASIAGGWVWAGRPGSLANLLGRQVYSLIPISIVFHFAHFLSDALVNLQHAAVALNDPLGNGANLLGLGHYHVTASFQNTASGALAFFTVQTAAVITGHILGVAVAHAIAIEQGTSRASVLRLEAPLAAFMVAFTAFGLWLLATPTIG